MHSVDEAGHSFGRQSIQLLKPDPGGYPDELVEEILCRSSAKRAFAAGS
jgi:hypothetical protein